MEDGVILFVAFAIGLTVGGITAGLMVNDDWRNILSQRGLSTYCPQDGRWAFKGECE